MGSRVRYENIEPILRRMEIYLLPETSQAEPCSCCKTAAAQFRATVWYDDDRDGAQPIAELLCRACVSAELLQEWGLSASAK